MFSPSVALGLIGACLVGCRGTGGAAVELLDAHNYSIDSQLSLTLQHAHAGADVCVDWSALEQDLRCSDLDPVHDVDNLSLMVFLGLDQEALELGMVQDSLLQSDMAGYASFEPGDSTQACFSELTFFGTDATLPERFQEGTGSWLMSLTTGTELGQGTRSLAFLEPLEASEHTQLEMPDNCGALDVQVDLHSLEPVPVQLDGQHVFRWSELTEDARWGAFEAQRVEQLSLAQYDGLDLEDLESGFQELELLADVYCEADVPSGTELDASELSCDGEPFEGFSAGGRWLLALGCPRCTNPAPPFLTVLQPG